MAASKSADLRPIQVFLDPKRFISTPDPEPFPRSSKDFFAGNNTGFAQHKKKMKGRVANMADTMRRATQPGGFFKVRQREEALAKSHRPLAALFTPKNKFAFVGADGVGELLFQATPAALENLAQVIESRAELDPRLVLDKKTRQEVPKASPHRSELGGIEDILFYDAVDRLSFSAEQAVKWMKQPAVIGGYIVELFRPDRAVDANAVDKMIAQLRTALKSVKGGLVVRPILPSSADEAFGQPSLALSVQLTTGRQQYVDLPFDQAGNTLEATEMGFPPSLRDVSPDLDVARHSELLAMLSEQSLVRTIELPPVLETTPNAAGATAGKMTISEPEEGVDYPIVGIVDGGVAGAVLGSWKVGDAGLVPDEDRDESHGTFIAGLVSAGGNLNPSLAAALETTGCRFYDLDLFPRRDLRGSYYKDLEELFDVLDEKVKVAKRDHGVRVFNLSFSIGNRSRLAYSVSADRLDRIARANDVIFVVAAGNLIGADSRAPWPQRAQDAAVMLASYSADNQQITAPSEHLLGLTVGAINPPGVPSHVEMVPTTYTRRGPGVGGARKPDLCHFGGADSRKHTGLVSITPGGDVVFNHGTSFASPLTSATVATLDSRLAGRAAREVLLSIPIHRAKRAEILEQRALRHIAREFVGFGISPVADELLHDEPHSVTLVFAARLLQKQRLEFVFDWPSSLVGEEGECRGQAEVTLCYTPPIDPDHREEAMRVQLDASLQQAKVDEDGEIKWATQLVHDASDVGQAVSKNESYLIRTGLKWSPIKRYRATMPKGRGNSSAWRLTLESLSRGGAVFPKEGVGFALVLTISDLARKSAVREEMRLSLQRAGVSLADITIAHRVRPRRA